MFLDEAGERDCVFSPSRCLHTTVHWTIGRTSTILSSLRTNRTPPPPPATALAETTKLGSRLTGRRYVPGGKRHSDSPGKALKKLTAAPLCCGKSGALNLSSSSAWLVVLGVAAWLRSA